MRNKNAKKFYCLVSHTHWDREWYEPFEQFRVRLVDLMDNLLELMEKDKDFIFHLDAQAAVLDDYLEIKPQNRERLASLISERRLMAGPWYIQNDFFLTSGEATVRNLILGRKRMKDFGTSDDVGYMPDQFGLISQLPQIFKGFGIGSAVFSRGLAGLPGDAGGIPSKNEFIWESPDGSKVTAVFMSGFYNNAQRLSADPEKALKFIRNAASKIADRSGTPYMLLMNGVDHLEAQENLNGILEKLKPMLDSNEEIAQVRLSDYVKLVRKEMPDSPEKWTGEMRKGILLSGTLCSRNYIKILNNKAQDLLEKLLEPLSSLAIMSGFLPREYKKELIDYLWKLLILNHPHDSICGCSRDEVHRHMADRYERLFETASMLVNKQLQLLSGHITGISEGSYTLNVFNTLPYNRDSVIDAVLEFPCEKKIKSFKILGPSREKIKFEILSKFKSEKPLRSPINLPGKIDVDCYNVRFHACGLPGIGFRQYSIVPDSSASIDIHTSAPGKLPCRLENEYLRVDISENGQVDISEKGKGKCFKDVLRIENVEDFGDSYYHKADPRAPGLISSSSFTHKLKNRVKDSFTDECTLAFNMRIPAGYDRKRKRRLSHLKNCRIDLTLRLSKGSGRLDVIFTMDNQAKDHLVRAVINSGISTYKVSASAPFDIVSRTFSDESISKDDNRNFKMQPTSDFVSISNGKKGMVLLLKGLQCYEHLDKKGKIGLPLLRANPYVFISSSGKLPLDPAWSAPENQCQGLFSAEFAIMPYAGSTGEISRAALEYRNKPLTCWGSSDLKEFSGGRPCVQDSELSEIFYREDAYKHVKLPPEKSFLTLDGRGIVFSACKLSENGNSLILRFFNSKESDGTASVKMSFVPGALFEVSLSEERIRQIPQPEDSAIFKMKPKEIKTLEIVL